MAFRIIVDGYNFIGRQKGLRGNIEAKREQLIDRLAQYRAHKGHAVTVVFDGHHSGWGDEHGEFRQGIEVVFSRHGETADEVMIRMAGELGAACLLVSSDREIARESRAAGAVAVSIGEFEARLMETMSGPEGRDSEGEEADRPAVRSKKGNPRKLSKQDRKKRQRLNKL
ncbi:MAG TPA: NYN domain-containing protein [Nitrospiria bacterium]